jgi:hypothetical protein
MGIVNAGYRTLRTLDPTTCLGDNECWSQASPVLPDQAHWQSLPLAVPPSTSARPTCPATPTRCLA